MEQGGVNNGDNNNEIMQVLYEDQLGKNLFLLAVAITAAFVASHGPVSLTDVGKLGVLAISIGVTVLWNAILFRRVSPRLSSIMEIIGAEIMLLSLFIYFSSVLPTDLALVPLLCFIVSLAPAIVGAARNFRRVRVHPENVENLPPAEVAALDMV